MSELRDTAEGMRDEISLLRSLMDHPGWKRIERIAEGQIQTRTDVVMQSRLRNLEEALEQECLKGEALGMKTLMALPKAEIERLEAELSSLDEVIEGEENGRSTSDTGDSLSIDGSAFDPIDERRDAFAGG